MHQGDGQIRKKLFLTLGILAGIIILLLAVFFIRRAVRMKKQHDIDMSRYEGMTDLTPEEIEELIRRDAAKEALAGLGDQESLAGLAADGKWVMDEPGDEGWSLSQAAPFFMRIRFDRSNEMLMEDQTALWRRTYNGKYLWDDEAVYAFVNNLKEKYDTEPGVVHFTTHDGRKLVFQSTNCGWHMDVDQTVQAIKNAAEAGEEIVDPVWSSGLVYSADNGVGKKYVEVDIPAQKVFLYEDDKLLLESDCVTGTKGWTDTVAGVYQIMYKASPSVLKDEDKEGNKYEQPVEYWISFNYSQGLHDALWRGEFGGDIYLTYGSHGCVNLPLEAAKTIYEEVYNYYPVVVYDDYIEGVNSPAAASGNEEAADNDNTLDAENAADMQNSVKEETEVVPAITSAGLPADALGG